MRNFLPGVGICALAGAWLQAAVISGTVVENQTGHPLARALVTIEPLAGSAGQRVSGRTNAYGAFQFTPVPAGTYLVSASRAGFATMQWGQRQWNSAGTPVSVGDNDAPHLTIRLPRFGSITGTVLDENDVGLPGYDVVAYRNTRPPELAARAKSDDRGIFRLFGLEPGSYLVRSAAREFDEISYLPTFSKETSAVEQAYPVNVTYDQQAEAADVRPIPGRLVTLTVEAVTVPPNPAEPLPVTMILASDIGRQTVQAASHRFGPIPPGTYDLFCQAPVERRRGIQGDYRRITVNANMSLSIVLHEVPELRLSFEGVPPDTTIPVLARRTDLAGDGPPELLKLVNNRVQLAAGPWELGVLPADGYYVSGFSGPRSQRVADGHADGWNQIDVGFGAGLVRVTLSTSPGSLSGTVKSAGEPVAGAPVFLEPSDLEPRRRVSGLLATRTDIRGQYRFAGLAPGNYRVFSSFEYRLPDAAVLTNAGAVKLTIEDGSEVRKDLELYVAQ